MNLYVQQIRYGKIPKPFLKNEWRWCDVNNKIWKVESRIDNAINYIKNKDRTKNESYKFSMDRFENIRDVLMYATNAAKNEKNFCGRNKL